MRSNYIKEIQKLEREKYKELKALVNKYEVVDVGSSSTNEKRVPMGILDAKVVPRLRAQGTYHLAIDGRELVVTRTDANTGWEENLQVTVYENGEEIDAKISEIEELAQMRLTLYKQMSEMNAHNQQIDNMAEELDYARNQLQTKYVSSNDNIRRSQINTYYDKQYQSYTSVLQVTILFAAVLLAIGAGYRMGFISETATQPILWVVLVSAVIVLGAMLRDLSRRDNMDYDSYIIPGNVSSQMSTSGDDETTTDSNVTPECRGAKCCAEGQRYDYIRQVCAEILDIQ